MQIEVNPIICSKHISKYPNYPRVAETPLNKGNYYDHYLTLDNILNRMKRYSDNTVDSDHSKKRLLEKDERYWTASTLISLIESEHCVEILKRLLINTFGETPPFIEKVTWDTLLGKKEDLNLILEAVIPAPKRYRWYMVEATKERILIPYILQQIKAGCLHSTYSVYEGPNQVDAVIINTKLEKPFSIFIEGKVLNDISACTAFDLMRNKIARNIDVMLTKDTNINIPTVEDKESIYIDPQKSLFLLLTPKIFKKYASSRLYAYKMREYKYNPLNINADLIHRKDITDWNAVADRIGWTTWEDIWEIGDKYNTMGKDKIFMRNFPDILDICHDCVRESVNEASSSIKESLNSGSALAASV